MLLIGRGIRFALLGLYDPPIHRVVLNGWCLVFPPKFILSEFRENVTNRINNFELTPIGPQPEITPGTLLVASPSLFETPFRKAVILIIQSNQNGTFGVVLNRPADEKIKYAWQELTGSNDGDANIVHGGPIGGPVFAIHQHHSIAELEMPGGIFVTAQSDKFQQLVQQDESRYRIVFGVAGWQEGQLGQELDEGMWYKIRGDAEQIFDDPDWMWEKSIRRYGQQVLCDVIGLNDVPGDPLSN